jgi:TPR repeat protein
MNTDVVQLARQILEEWQTFGAMASIDKKLESLLQMLFREVKEKPLSVLNVLHILCTQSSYEEIGGFRELLLLKAEPQAVKAFFKLYRNILLQTNPQPDIAKMIIANFVDIFSPVLLNSLKLSASWLKEPSIKALFIDLLADFYFEYGVQNEKIARIVRYLNEDKEPKVFLTLQVASECVEKGKKYFYGKGVPVDFEAAFSSFQEARRVAPGYVPAALSMAQCFWEGKGTDKNPLKALEVIALMYKGLAGAQKTDLAGKVLQDLKLKLNEVVNAQAAAEKAQIAAEKVKEAASVEEYLEDPRLPYTLGEVYFHIASGLKNSDPKEAHVYFQKAAEQGKMLAFADLAEALAVGTVAGQSDYKAALEQFKLLLAQAMSSIPTKEERLRELETCFQAFLARDFLQKAPRLLTEIKRVEYDYLMTMAKLENTSKRYLEVAEALHGEARKYRDQLCGAAPTKLQFGDLKLLIAAAETRAATCYSLALNRPLSAAELKTAVERLGEYCDKYLPALNILMLIAADIKKSYGESSEISQLMIGYLQKAVKSKNAEIRSCAAKAFYSEDRSVLEEERCRQFALYGKMRDDLLEDKNDQVAPASIPYGQPIYPNPPSLPSQAQSESAVTAEYPFGVSLHEAAPSFEANVSSVVEARADSPSAPPLSPCRSVVAEQVVVISSLGILPALEERASPEKSTLSVPAAPDMTANAGSSPQAVVQAESTAVGEISTSVASLVVASSKVFVSPPLTRDAPQANKPTAQDSSVRRVRATDHRQLTPA